MDSNPDHKSPSPRTGHEGNLPQMPTPHPQPTIVLQPESEGNPAITLTVYKHERTPSNKPEPLVRIFEPSAFIYDEDTCTRPTPLCANLAEREEDVGDGAHMLKLSSELEEHFQCLKDAFEDTTGRSWSPLTCWESEAWEWDDGNEEELGMFDWI